MMMTKLDSVLLSASWYWLSLRGCVIVRSGEMSMVSVESICCVERRTMRPVL